MSKKKNKLTAIVLVLLSCVLLVFALERISNHVGSAQRVSEKPVIKGTILSESLPLPAVSLMDQNGELFNNDNFKGRWTLLFFGFTNCPKVCPTTLAQLSGMMRDLAAKVSGDHLPQVALVTIDPERDSIERMKSYVTSFNPGFIGLRTDEKSIAKLALAMNVSYAKVAMDGMDHDHMDHYTMTHTATITVIGPDGGVKAYLSYPHQAHEMAHDFLAILGYYHAI